METTIASKPSQFQFDSDVQLAHSLLIKNSAGFDLKQYRKNETDLDPSGDHSKLGLSQKVSVMIGGRNMSSALAWVLVAGASQSGFHLISVGKMNWLKDFRRLCKAELTGVDYDVMFSGKDFNTGLPVVIDLSYYMHYPKVRVDLRFARANAVRVTNVRLALLKTAHDKGFTSHVSAIKFGPYMSFPDFKLLCDLISQLGCREVHRFPFSARPEYLVLLGGEADFVSEFMTLLHNEGKNGEIQKLGKDWFDMLVDALHCEGDFDSKTVTIALHDLGDIPFWRFP